MKKYIIIPGCSDLNRGDQALAWETKRLGEEAGFVGEYYLTAEKNEPVQQSERQGIHVISPIMEHPSRVFKSKSNIKYGLSLKIKWGIVSIFDFIGSLFYLNKVTRVFLRIFAKKKESLKAFMDADAIFVKGGGLLQTYGGLASTYSMYFWCFHIFLAHSLQKPIYVMPNSFGPFEGPLVKRVAKRALSYCTVVTSRESLSTIMVKEQLGFSIDTYPDLAFNLPMSQLSRDDVFSKYNLPQDRKLVAVTMRPYRFPLSEDSDTAYITFKSEMAKFLRWLYAEGFMPVVIEHTLAVNAHENDAACIKDVLSQVDDAEYRYISNKDYDCHDLKKIYSFCDYIIGTRFHSVIFSLGSGVPGIAICYVGNKGQGIMKDIGLGDYAISIYDVTAEALKIKFKSLIDNEKDVKLKINAYNAKVKIEYQELMNKCK